jgi:hypothetical protein
MARHASWLMSRRRRRPTAPGRSNGRTNRVRPPR